MRINTALAAAAALASVPAIALGDSYDSIAVTATFGAGAIGFTDEDSTDYASVGTSIDARLAFRANPWLELETAYIGTIQDIDALGLDTSTLLLGNGLEASVRANFIDAEIQPYVFAGAGWMRYDLAFADSNTSDVNDTDNLATFPMGIGVGYRANRFLLDVRGTFRAAADADMFAPPGGDQAMHTWSAELRAGFEL
jgi:hypothetical protein